MSYQLTKADKEMIRAAGGSLNTAGMQALEAGVVERLSQLMGAGFSITRNHVRAACTQELNRKE